MDTCRIGCSSTRRCGVIRSTFRRNKLAMDCMSAQTSCGWLAIGRSGVDGVDQPLDCIDRQAVHQRVGGFRRTRAIRTDDSQIRRWQMAIYASYQGNSRSPDDRVRGPPTVCSRTRTPCVDMGVGQAAGISRQRLGAEFLHPSLCCRWDRADCAPCRLVARHDQVRIQARSGSG